MKSGKGLSMRNLEIGIIIIGAARAWLSAALTSAGREQT
jgi:hypothetical protein